MKFYAGIGARKTPPEILEKMTKIAQILSRLGYTLRSGGAKGADSAFEKGAVYKQIYKAEHATPEAIEIAKLHHNAWDSCSSYAKKLHGRNALIILGDTLNSPVDFVLCWTIPNVPYGGTKLGMRIANTHHIPVFNLYLEEELKAFKEYLKINFEN